MNEPAAPNASPAPAAAASAAPAAQPGGTPAPAAAQRPDYVPESFWDATAGVKPEFAAHLTEIETFHKTETEKRAALAARKPEDIKFEVKLPPEVKIPEGMQVKIDEKDPRIPILREMALEQGWDQPVIDKLVAMDARLKIEAHTAETARIAAEDAKLGANGKVRKDSVSNWAKGLLESKAITPEEHEVIRWTASDAAGVTLLEKLIAKANGSVPGVGGQNPPPAQDTRTVEQRWYGQKG